MSLVSQLSKDAAEAARVLAVMTTEDKNAVLADMAAALRDNKQHILSVNKTEVKRAIENGLDSAMVDRLTLNEVRIEEMAQGIETIIELPDPAGKVRFFGERPNGLKIEKMRVPLGVVCMIYEARPNVTADAGALCFKSGNGIILRGGKEALQSSLAIVEQLHKVLAKHQLPQALITVIPDADRQLMNELLEQRQYIDVVIPRGGEGLINFVTDNSKIPVIQHFKGVCHLYVDKEADLNVALALLLNGKTQRTGVCNALEGLIVHQDIADRFLPRVATELESKDVKIHVNELGKTYFSSPNILSETEYGQEYLGLEIAIRVVEDFDTALSHIAEFGSNHTEVICTTNTETEQRFLRTVDASVVMSNASSRFSDGGQLGLGAEIGIATTKLHAYGPMGLESLTTEKYIVSGEGQIRS